MENKSRILCISDIHGEYDKFKKLLSKVNYDKNTDQLILLGDYVDRGPKNIDTLMLVKKLTQQGAIALIGNHEQMMVDCINSMINKDNNRIIDLYLECGGFETYNELINLSNNKLSEIREFVISLPYMHIIDKYIFVHAGVDSKKQISENSSDVFLWARKEFIFSKAYEGFTVIFGHTPTPYLNVNKEYAIWYDTIYNDKICIDCGCVYGGKLACLDLTNKKEYYI